MLNKPTREAIKEGNKLLIVVTDDQRYRILTKGKSYSSKGYNRGCYRLKTLYKFDQYTDLVKKVREIRNLYGESLFSFPADEVNENEFNSIIEFVDVFHDVHDLIHGAKS